MLGRSRNHLEPPAPPSGLAEKEVKRRKEAETQMHRNQRPRLLLGLMTADLQRIAGVALADAADAMALEQGQGQGGREAEEREMGEDDGEEWTVEGEGDAMDKEDDDDDDDAIYV